MGTIITRPKTGRTPKSIDAGEELIREKVKVWWPHDKKDSSKKSKDNSNKGSKSRDEISTKAKEEKDGKSRMQLLNLEE
ncbi:uncharacterized protein LOC113344193 isoform X5 [Papaver somniferum]|uniref:uncharacterized protein LOC113344193 isoform X5 n=1 Tax=Papaver somniferum TaxID=3469 RepID=UPI000E6F8A0F|nr:uncharacterized protein LOC113344193 isoform X5 [Papaver somniferum]